MERIVLTAREKQELWRSLPVWNREDLRRPLVEKTAMAYGVPVREVYATLLHLDTLQALGQAPQLVWKGGTAIQSYLESEWQRTSTDLDFNSTTANVEILREAFDEFNAQLEKKDAIVRLKGIPFGMFFEADHRPEYKTMEFRRLLPTPFDERVELKRGNLPGFDRAVRVQGRMSRVQINYGHHRLPALGHGADIIRFFTHPTHKPRDDVFADRASINDLAADKILATTRHDGFGRERFKDLYDLNAMRHSDMVDIAQVTEKLGRIVGEDRLPAIIEGTMETLRILGIETANAQGFRASVCTGGKEWVDRWDKEIEETQQWIMECLDI